MALNVGTTEFALLTLILMRMSGFIFMNPVLGRKGIPSVAKVGMTLVLTYLIYSINPPYVDVDIFSPLSYGIILLKEFFIGYFSGYIMYLFDFSIVYAGSIMDFQMGLAMASVYDPASGTQTPLSGRLLQIYYMLLFFAVDGHLALMSIIVNSSKVLPFGATILGTEAAKAALDILMKMIPQFNLIILSIQLKIVIGMIMLILSVSPIGDFISNMISEMLHLIENSLYIMSG